jgi:hypothetical protein
MRIDLVAAAKTGLLLSSVFAVFVVATIYPPVGAILFKILLAAAAVITVYNVYRLFALVNRDRDQLKK